MVLLFNSILKLFPGKSKSKWSGPFRISQVYSSGVVELENNDGGVFKATKKARPMSLPMLTASTRQWTRQGLYKSRQWTRQGLYHCLCSLPQLGNGQGKAYTNLGNNIGAAYTNLGKPKGAAYAIAYALCFN
ncbi:hypothetical protein CQW23_14528 [Capsicum baccatum]|uniref:Uncharacterized protein n=1 Tax=Capsicum baccatum TaxID=33114 RepID=A0A2G2WJP8_CAPBA|nr:hypothetical protein CQW23_14528 [Capsicum baccatum]